MKEIFTAIDNLLAWISRTPSSAERMISERVQRQSALDESTINLMRAVDDPAFIDACALLAQLGLSAAQVERISHAMQHRRILAFSAGSITDLGEAGNWLDGSTRGSKTYEGDQS